MSAMLAGIAVSLAASILGGVPVLRTELRSTPAPPLALLGSLAVRFFFALAAAAYLILTDLVAGAPFILWLGISYLLLLPLDVRYALRSNPNRADGDIPGGAPGARPSS